MRSTTFKNRVLALSGMGISLAMLIAFARPGAGFSAAAGSPAGNPQTIVMNTVAEATQVLSDHRMPTETRRQKLVEIVSSRFDFSGMARSSLGYQWRRLTPAQQNQFVQLFTAFIEDVYLNKLDGYQGQKIEYLPSPPLGPTQAEVRTLVLQPNGQEPVRVNYMLKPIDGQWRVYDVTVDNLSITANYRDQFNHVINTQGFDALIQKMQAKRDQLVASMNK